MRIGVLGGGQLGRMLALAGYPLGLEFVFYDRNPDASAAGLGKLVIGEFDDKSRLTEFAQQVDVVTIEFENIPLSAIEHVAQFVPVYPGLNAVSTAQDRLNERRLFESLGIPTPGFHAVDDTESLTDIAQRQHDTLVVKSRRFGYDGKGQFLLEPSDDAAKVWAALGEVPLIIEQRMLFSREVSMIAVRNRRGETGFYPLTENLHKLGILRRSQVSMHDPLQNKAAEYAQCVMRELDYVGVLAFEFFDCDGKLVANEIAPRVHNSGHWTIEGAVTSQFENHLRAILGWPLGDTSARASCIMYNIIAEEPDIGLLLQIPDLHVHYYRKSPLPGRKLGHVTLLNPSVQSATTVDNIINGYLESESPTTNLTQKKSAI